MNQGRIIVITGAPGTGKTTTASAVAKESDLEKSVHMHTDDFYHYHVRKPSAREYDDCCNEFWNVTPMLLKDCAVRKFYLLLIILIRLFAMSC